MSRLRLTPTLVLAALIGVGDIASAQSRPFGTVREQAELQQTWLEKRLKTILPGLMRQHGIDLWVIPMREYNEDPTFTSLVSPTTFAARRRTIYVFFDKCAAAGRIDQGDGSCVERIALGGTSQGGLYEAVRTTKAVDAAVAARPADRDLQTLRERVCTEQGDWAGAVDALEALAALEEGDARTDTLLRAANLCDHSVGDPARAKRLFEDVVRARPEAVDAWAGARDTEAGLFSSEPATWADSGPAAGTIRNDTAMRICFTRISIPGMSHHDVTGRTPRARGRPAHGQRELVRFCER